MLKIDTLKGMIQDALTEYLGSAMSTSLKTLMPQLGDQADEACAKFADTFTETCAEPLADALAGAIDYYVRSISISGTIITAGSPTTQTATIVSPNGATNGSIPNSLGIN